MDGESRNGNGDPRKLNVYLPEQEVNKKKRIVLYACIILTKKININLKEKRPKT